MINSIRIPPLRERIDDIPLLAEYFLREEVKKTRKKIRGFSDECLVMLKHYNYPNNVQELLTIVASAVAREESGMITVESLPSTLTEGFETGQEAQKKTFEPRTLNDVIEDQIKRTLHYFNGDKKKAAEKLGISPERIDKIVEDSD